MDVNILDQIDPVVLGEALKKARNRAGLNQAEAAEILGVSRTTITAIENGGRRIAPGELIRLARAYDRPLSDFVGARPQVRDFVVLFRGPHALRAETDDAKIAPYINELEDLCTDYLELEGITGSPLHTDYPPEYRVVGRDIDQEAALLADRERRRLGLGDGPIQNLRDILENEIGLRVFYVDMRHTAYSAIYIYSQELGGCIGINRLHPEERRRLSAAHDYAHFLAHRYQPALFVEGGYQRIPRDELFADSFASHFLMPGTSVLRQFEKHFQEDGKITPASLLSMASYFGMSLAAMTLRLEDLGKLRRGQWEEIRDSGFRVREAQEQLGRSPLLGRDDRFPSRYQYLALYAYDNALISEGQFAHYLRADRVESRLLAEKLRQHTMDATDTTKIEINLSQEIPER